MDKREKYRVWLMAGVALLALVILAAGLSELELRPGWPLSDWLQLLLGNLTIRRGEVTPGSLLDITRVVRLLVIIFLLLLPLFILGLILYPDLRKKMLRELLRMLIFLSLAYILTRSEFIETMIDFGSGPINFVALPSPGEESASSALEVMPQFDTRSPSWLTWVTSFALALALAAGIAGLIWTLLRRLSPQSTPMDELAQEAQAALEALQSGADFRNTIIRCYREMSEVLRARRGIQRDGAMTPREFEAQLAHHGLPGGPVHQLTLLFEQVRYGADAPGEMEEDRALTCLTAIVETCRNV